MRGGDAMKRWLNQCHLGDCLEVMRQMPDNCVDSIVTDPPYGIRFMGKSWDGADIEKTFREANTDAASRDKTGRAAAAGKYDLRPDANKAFQYWTEQWAAEALRVLKPGGYLLCFASTRTYHRMATGVEDAGFEIRDQLGWMFGSGFPKSHNGEWGGTALKPAWEPICMARKPLIGTVEVNWREHGTGALNIDGCRIEGESTLREKAAGPGQFPHEDDAWEPKAVTVGSDVGRWPANLIHDGSAEVVALFPQSAGQQGDVRGTEPSGVTNGIYGDFAGRVASSARNDAGSAARFFYCAKASSEDRNEGMYGFTPKQQDEGRKAGNPGGDNPRNRGVHERKNHHPTVKPTDLMRYLCRLVTPLGGIVLDPFMGSGSTGRAAVLEGFQYIGCERDAGYIEIARARIDSARRQGHQPSLDLQAA